MGRPPAHFAVTCGHRPLTARTRRLPFRSWRRSSRSAQRNARGWPSTSLATFARDLDHDDRADRGACSARTDARRPDRRRGRGHAHARDARAPRGLGRAGRRLPRPRHGAAQHPRGECLPRSGRGVRPRAGRGQQARGWTPCRPRRLRGAGRRVQCRSPGDGRGAPHRSGGRLRDRRPLRARHPSASELAHPRALGRHRRCRRLRPAEGLRRRPGRRGHRFIRGAHARHPVEHGAGGQLHPQSLDGRREQGRPACRHAGPSGAGDEHRPGAALPRHHRRGPRCREAQRGPGQLVADGRRLPEAARVLLLHPRGCRHRPGPAPAAIRGDRRR